MDLTIVHPRLTRALAFAIEAHTNRPRKPEMAFRGAGQREGEATPYWTHVAWCACMATTESSIPAELRAILAEALILHDVLEDTTVDLPDDTPERVRLLVEEATFDGTADERTNVWCRSREVRLLKLFDKTQNLLDRAGLNPRNRKAYAEFTLRLADDVERSFGGNLNILVLARAICAQVFREDEAYIASETPNGSF